MAIEPAAVAAKSDQEEPERDHIAIVHGIEAAALQPAIARIDDGRLPFPQERLQRIVRDHDAELPGLQGDIGMGHRALIDCHGSSFARDHGPSTGHWPAGDWWKRRGRWRTSDWLGRCSIDPRGAGAVTFFYNSFQSRGRQ